MHTKTSFTFDDPVNSADLEELVITHDDGSHFIYKLNQTQITVGRENDNDVVLPSSSVSRHHAQLSWSQGEWFITDLGSTNGVRYGLHLHEPNQPHRWQLNETIRIGQYRLQLRQQQRERASEGTLYLQKYELDPIVGYLRYNQEEKKTAGRCTFTMWPLRLRDGEQLNLCLQNEGTRHQNYEVVWQSDSPVHFSAEHWLTDVPAGAERRKRLVLRAQKRPFIGHGYTEYSFTIRLNQQTTIQPLQGTLLVTPRIQAAQLRLFLGILAGIAVATLLFFVVRALLL